MVLPPSDTFQNGAIVDPYFGGEITDLKGKNIFQQKAIDGNYKHDLDSGKVTPNENMKQWIVEKGAEFVLR